MHISTIIFDLDGTLVDSIPANYRAAKRAAAKFGIEVTEDDFAHVNGMSAQEGFAWLVREKGAGKNIDPRAILRAKRAEQSQIKEETTVYPDTLPTLERLQQAYTMAIATSGSRAWLNYMDKRYGLKQYIVDAVTASEFVHSKPNPRIFLEAAKKAGKPAEECIVIEDSTNGIIAARRASMASIAILTTTKKQLFIGEAEPDLFINSIGELDRHTIARAGERANIRLQAEE